MPVPHSGNLSAEPGQHALSMRSAVDWWLVLLLAASIGAVLYLAAQVVNEAPLQAVGALVLAFVASSVVLMRGVPCHYTLDQDTLHIRGGIESWHIPYVEIERVERIWSPQGAPAWSANRLCIHHRRGREQISPLDRDRFEQHLLQRMNAPRTAMADPGDGD